MKTVQQKIRDTVLFIPEEKVEILVAFESFSQLDREQLEDIIDEYDKEYQNITKKFKDAMFQELEKYRIIHQAKINRDWKLLLIR